MEISQERLQRFWEQYGFKQVEVKQGDGEGFSYDLHWRYEDYDSYELPKVTLDNLFKFAVPKLHEMGLNVELRDFCEPDWVEFMGAITKKRKIVYFAHSHDTAEEALFCAIEEVFNAK
jgi:hypothetical protein